MRSSLTSMRSRHHCNHASQEPRKILVLFTQCRNHCYFVPLQRISAEHQPRMAPFYAAQVDVVEGQHLLCDDYNEGKCNSPNCPFVHADIEGLERHTIHVNYSWQSESSVAYARLPAGETLHVLAPNNRPPTDDIPSERVLVTKGSLSAMQNNGHGTHRPLSHCAHFYFNHVCNRGESCSFIHSVHIDCTASRGQHAPAPAVVHRSDKAVKSTPNPSPVLSPRTPYFRTVTPSEDDDDTFCVAFPAIMKSSLEASQLSATKSAPVIAPLSSNSFSLFYAGNCTVKHEGCRTLIVSPASQDLIAYRNNPYANKQQK